MDHMITSGMIEEASENAWIFHCLHLEHTWAQLGGSKGKKIGATCAKKCIFKLRTVKKEEKTAQKMNFEAFLLLFWH